MHRHGFRAKTGRMFLHTFLISLPWLFSGCTSPTGSPPTRLSDKWLVYKQSPGRLVNNYINALLLDRGRTIWLATNDGVSSFSRGTWASLRDSLGYPTGVDRTISHRVSCIVQAKDGAMWFGLSGGGVVRYNPFSSIQVWRRYIQPDLVWDVVLAGAADVSNQSLYGEVWLTTAFGISRFIGAANERGYWVTYNMANTSQLPSNQIPACLNKLDDNTFWFGTQTGGA